ncbi:inorganic phosphate transporter [Caballeronia arationis]|uniref:inorganic phosphate transporter n=1 Tax=Caballeronia arationis TaxID=1777142 RepID=UPI000B35F24C|nr:inorganic phosphate transporter [Caballeronia arationis]
MTRATGISATCYTGATMGMAYGTGVIRKPMTALLLIAFFVVLGATFECHNVVTTVGTRIIPGQFMTPLGAMVMMLTAAVVTAANTWMKWPVSTSQLACCSVDRGRFGHGCSRELAHNGRVPVHHLDRHPDRQRAARIHPDTHHRFSHARAR